MSLYFIRTSNVQTTALLAVQNEVVNAMQTFVETCYNVRGAEGKSAAEIS